MLESGPKTVLVTGAAGNIGAKICAYLQAKPGYRLVRLDRDPGPQTGVIAADLRRYRQTWRSHFAGADVLVHLAGNPNADSDWHEVLEDNIDATMNVFEAAVAHGLHRVVFASSLHAALASTAGNNPHRASPYGLSKLVGERLGKHYATAHGLSLVCLRLGMVRRGANPPPHDHGDLATQRRWLSNADLCRAVECAIVAQHIDYGVCNITSRITSATEETTWELDTARGLLGYVPNDTFTPVPPTLMARLARRLRRLLAPS
jgi:nucleoside-diphosphate-sugar epimerase